MTFPSRQESPTDLQSESSGVPRPFDEVLVAEPGEEDPWAWSGKPALLLTGHGAFVCRQELFYQIARNATTRDLQRVFGDTGRAFARGAGWTALKLTDPIPLPLLFTAWSFFLAAWNTYHTEDILLLYFFPREKRYDLRHPPLRHASENSVGYEILPTPTDAVLFGSLHSHPRAAASHSPRDNQDVWGVPGLHITVGDLDLPLPSLWCVLSTGQECLRVHPYDIFARPSASAIPPTWLARAEGLPVHPRTGGLPPTTRGEEAYRVS